MVFNGKFIKTWPFCSCIEKTCLFALFLCVHTTKIVVICFLMAQDVHCFNPGKLLWAQSVIFHPYEFNLDITDDGGDDRGDDWGVDGGNDVVMTGATTGATRGWWWGRRRERRRGRRRGYDRGNDGGNDGGDDRGDEGMQWRGRRRKRRRLRQLTKVRCSAWFDHNNGAW